MYIDCDCLERREAVDWRNRYGGGGGGGGKKFILISPRVLSVRKSVC